MKFDFKETLGTISKVLDEHKPEVATGVGIALMLGGTVGAVVATVKTMRAAADVKEAKLAEIAPTAEAYNDLSAEEVQLYDEIEASPMPAKEVMSVCWKWWMIPTLAEALGIFCLIFSNRESAKRIGSLTALLAYQIAENKDYKAAAKELLGEEKEKEVEDEAAQKSAKRKAKDCDKVYSIDNGEELLQDYYSGQPFRGSMNQLEKCLLELNKLVYKRSKSSLSHWVTLNDWYDILGIPKTGLGEEFGWDAYDYGPDPGVDITFDYSNRNAYKNDNLESVWIVRFSPNTTPNYIFEGR